ncbi:MAG: MarR family transcriptional regulator [Nanoarchaeota archaeon]
MKQEGKQTRNKRTPYWSVAILCLVYGGVALILFTQQVYSLYVREPFRPPERMFNDSFIAPDSNVANTSTVVAEFMRTERFRTQRILPLIATLCGSIISIFAGISLLNLLRHRESKELKKELLDAIILPDEKLVIQELEKHDGELTQSELVTRTKLSKVKVHRIVKRLESLGIVKKYPYGLTNKIRLEKSILMNE